MTPDQYARWLNKLPDRVAGYVAPALDRGGQRLKTRIQANASGRPGPNVVTGDYRGAWDTEPIPGVLGVRVFNNRPQGPRLEYGYSGTDSMGRTYDQPPFPHVGPAVQSESGPIIEDIKQSIVKGLR